MPATALGDPRRIAVFRALQLGDLLCAVPALRALRRAHPQARITLVGLPWAATFVTRFAHLIDDFLAFPGFPGLPEREPDLAAFPAFVSTAQAARFDAALQLHGRGNLTNSIVALLGAPIIAGFRAPGQWCADPALHAPWPEAGHEIGRLLMLMDHLGIPRAGLGLEFPLAAAERAHATALCERHALTPGRYACVHPGARLHSRRWPPEYFAAVARSLTAAGLRVVVTGDASEADLTAAVARAVPGAIDLAAATTLGALGALLQGARVLVCNDTGVSHVAAALATPSVVVSCGADPWRFAPLDAGRHDVVYAAMACRPCAHDRCPIGHPCARVLTPDRVTRHVTARIGAD